MSKWIALLVLVLCPLSATAQNAEPEQEAAEIEWPLPWRAGVKLSYDQQYRSVNRRDGDEYAVTATDVVEIAIVRADEDGFLQRWTSTDPKYDTGSLPPQIGQVMRVAAEAMSGLPLDVRLDREGAYQALSNMDDLHPRYSAALRKMFDDALGPAAKADATAAQAVDRMLAMITAKPVLEQQLAEMPAAYNFVAGGGLELGNEYAYDDEGTSPLGGEPIKMRNTMLLSEADDPAYYALRWHVVPDAEATAAMIRKAVGDMLAGSPKDPKQAANEEYQKAMDSIGKNAMFSTTVTYLVEKASGVVERMEHVQVKRIGTKDETTTSVLTIRR